jgi:hypothetical protein
MASPLVEVEDLLGRLCSPLIRPWLAVTASFALFPGLISIVSLAQ